MEYTYKYPRPSLTADVLAVNEQEELLLVERGGDPYRGCWALPGGFMEMDETLEECAVRELHEETGIAISTASLQLVGVFSRVDRDPRGRTVTAAYAVKVESNIATQAGDDAAALRWWPLATLPPLAFDHAEIVARFLALRRG